MIETHFLLALPSDFVLYFDGSFCDKVVWVENVHCLSLFFSRNTGFWLYIQSSNSMRCHNLRPQALQKPVGKIGESAQKGRDFEALSPSRTI
mmetsp:Transcript_9358/g.31291  ORF Transcript_9358/g.31291 Transcript_9358/m.31291 type:complete len:92 (-) Transcript_9358:75-350(-)